MDGWMDGWCICTMCVSDLREFQEVMINVGDVGEDYEHGVQLLKKLSEFRGTGDGVRAQRQAPQMFHRRGDDD